MMRLETTGLAIPQTEPVKSLLKDGFPALHLEIPHASRSGLPAIGTRLPCSRRDRAHGLCRNVVRRRWSALCCRADDLEDGFASARRITECMEHLPVLLSGNPASRL